MAEVISLSTFHNHNLTDQDHALFMQTVTSQSGLFYGCEVTLKDENTLHVSTGEGIACGRIFRIMDMDYPVELSASGDLLGRLYVHIDTALDDTPAQLMDVQGSTLPALIQEDDMNQGTGVYEIELATFSINELGISNLEFTAPKATGGGAGGKSIAPDYVATESYEKGRIFFQNGTLYRTIAAIPAGAPLVVDTNVVETSLAAEIEALNQNLTNCLVWNPEDDYAYVGGRKTVLKVGLNKQYLFVNGQWQTTDREDSIPQLAYSSSGYNCIMDGGIQISDGTLALELIGGGHGRATQIRIENQGKPIVIKYRTSPSASVSEQELRFDTQLYQTSYLVLASASWGNPVTYYIHMELFNSRQTRMVIQSGTWQQNPVYITEIYVDA